MSIEENGGVAAPPGYWRASDGNWYPPHLQPGPAIETYTYTYGDTNVSPRPQPNSTAIAAMVLGIISVVGFWAAGIGIAVGIVAVVLGAVVLAGRREGRQAGRGQATAGIVLGVVGVILGAGFLVVSVLIADDIDTDPSNGSCNSQRFLQDPDC